MPSIGYLMNIYPVTSATFIRREIRALEAGGFTVNRYAIRRWSDILVDPQDEEERARTRYLLSGKIVKLFTAFVSEIIINPIGMIKAMKTWAALLSTAKGGVIRHSAYLLEAVSLKRQMQQDKVAHLHAHFSTNTAAVALLAQRLGGPSYSFTAHGPDEFIDWGPSSLKMKVEGAHFVVAISNYCRAQLVLAAGQACWDKIHIVRCGVPINEFTEGGQPFDAAAPFVCVGRLCPQKAQVLIVHALAGVVETHPDIRVVMIGDGESRANIETAIAYYGLQKHIDLLGWQKNSKIREILGSARALLLPSLAEGLPVAIMEAHALGRPVISTYIAGIPELVDRSTGWIIPAGSVDDIGQALKQAMDATPKVLEVMGQVGKQRVLENHDIEKNAAHLGELIKNAIRDTATDPMLG